jgi:hypothetical protein
VFDSFQSTLKGLYSDAILSGLNPRLPLTQGWQQKTLPTLGFEIMPLKGITTYGSKLFEYNLLKKQETAGLLSPVSWRFNPRIP